MRGVPDESERRNWLRVNGELPRVHTNEVWVVNLEGCPLDKPIMRPGVTSEVGCLKSERERRVDDLPGERQPGHSVRRERRDPRHSLFYEENKIYKTTQRKRHRMDWLCGLELKNESVSRGSLSQRTNFI